jgi:hypothetical protein
MAQVAVLEAFALYQTPVVEQVSAITKLYALPCSPWLLWVRTKGYKN